MMRHLLECSHPCSPWYSLVDNALVLSGRDVVVFLDLKAQRLGRGPPPPRRMSSRPSRGACSLTAASWRSWLPPPGDSSGASARSPRPRPRLGSTWTGRPASLRSGFAGPPRAAASNSPNSRGSCLRPPRAQSASGGSRTTSWPQWNSLPGRCCGSPVARGDSSLGCSARWPRSSTTAASTWSASLSFRGTKERRSPAPRGCLAPLRCRATSGKASVPSVRPLSLCLPSFAVLA
mmetsp:Transcript_95846/g.270979  ORF Transcript_95846/g.270979 Transcript_95846/m.270979 type:complete len:234 (+) Transcript_95846:38-739(+)